MKVEIRECFDEFYWVIRDKRIHWEHVQRVGEYSSSWSAKRGAARWLHNHYYEMEGVIVAGKIARGRAAIVTGVLDSDWRDVLAGLERQGKIEVVK